MSEADLTNPTLFKFVPYRFINILTQRSYIGFSRNVPCLKRKLWSLLSRGTHPNVELQRDFKLCGAEIFRFQAPRLWAGEDTYQPQEGPEFIERAGLGGAEVRRDPSSGCLLWGGGRVIYRATPQQVAAWSMYPNQVVFFNGMGIFTKCLNWRCVEPSHLVFYYRQGGKVHLHR